MLALLILLSVLFFATHLGMSHDPYRAKLIEKLGAKPFMGVYSLVSFLTFGGAIWVFAGHRNMGPQLWGLSAWLLPIVYVLMFLSFFLLAFLVVNPAPTGMKPGAMEAKGVLRITRHPMNMGFACFALAHVLANGFLGDIFFFGSILAVGFFGPFHQDQRKTRELGQPYVEFQKKTSVIPFAAIVTGKMRLEPGEFKKAILIGVIVAFVAVVLLHKTLFGVSPF